MEEYEHCVNTTCATLSENCINEDTLCFAHYDYFEKCKVLSNESSCVECVLAESDDDYKPFQSEQCGVCYNYCADKGHHRNYSLGFNYLWECSMGCGSMEYESKTNASLIPTISTYYKCLENSCKALEEVCEQETACDNSKYLFDFCQIVNPDPFCK